MCCQLHIAALIAEYLKLRGNNAWGADAFAEISMNITRDETGLKIDEGKSNIDGVFNITLYYLRQDFYSKQLT